MKIHFLLAIVFFSVAASSCKDEEIEKSYYYWRSNYTLNDIERQALAKTEKLYVKVCDVVAGREGTPEPVAVTIWKDQPMEGIQYSPVVFIDKEVFISRAGELGSEKLSMLAKDIFTLVSSSWEYNQLSFDEIQIDCDWTPKSQKQYFIFLKELKKISSKKITSTLRLDQIKNYKITGVPSVDEGVVMAYNMGNISQSNAQNSILSMPVLKQYINSSSSYPLPAKLALPIFSWKLLYRDNHFKGIFSHLSDSILKANFRTTDRVFYANQSTFYWEGFTFKKNDVIRVEQVSSVELAKAEKYIRSHLALLKETIYFDLSSKNLINYE
jgi:uncharacterized protein involved in tolerance to divalent cations